MMFLQRMTIGWHPARVMKLIELEPNLAQIAGRPILHQRILPAVLPFSRRKHNDMRHSVWKKHYDQERARMAKGELTFISTPQSEPRAVPFPGAPSRVGHCRADADDGAGDGLVWDLGESDTVLLHAMATAWGRDDVVKEVEACCEQNVLYNVGATMLHLHARNGRRCTVEFLLDRGANPSCLDGGENAHCKTGFYPRRSTPLAYCKESMKGGFGVPIGIDKSALKECYSLLKAAEKANGGAGEGGGGAGEGSEQESGSTSDY